MNKKPNGDYEENPLHNPVVAHAARPGSAEHIPQLNKMQQEKRALPLQRQASGPAKSVTATPQQQAVQPSFYPTQQLWLNPPEAFQPAATGGVAAICHQQAV